MVKKFERKKNKKAHKKGQKKVNVIASQAWIVSSNKFVGQPFFCFIIYPLKIVGASNIVQS